MQYILLLSAIPLSLAGYVPSPDNSICKPGKDYCPPGKTCSPIQQWGGLCVPTKPPQPPQPTTKEQPPPPQPTTKEQPPPPQPTTKDQPPPPQPTTSKNEQPSPPPQPTTKQQPQPSPSPPTQQCGGGWKGPKCPKGYICKKDNGKGDECDYNDAKQWGVCVKVGWW